MRYKAAKDVEVSSTNARGEEVRVSFSKGSVSTTDADEIAVLDTCATDPDNPIGFDPKE